MSQPLLSVIVPCYNVEQYLDKCVASIVTQTYTNLEIVLVNDGSTDSTGAICNTWQERDNRIKVIHKQNEGNAYARKTGIDNATAEYLSFIDSDDWIDVDMFTNMMAALLSTCSDIAQCGVCLVYEDGSMKDWDNEKEERIVERIEGVLLILENNKWRSWMCNRIFKKHLFDNVVFPKGRGGCGDFVTLFAFHRANQCVCLPGVYYYYLQKRFSVTRASNMQGDIKNQCDYFDAWHERYCFVAQHPEYHSALPSIKLWVLRLGFNLLLPNIIVQPQYFTKDYFDAKAKEMRSIPITQSDRLSRRLKINLYVLKLSPKLYKFLKTFYLHILRIANKLKITNRQTPKTLSEFFGW